MTIQPAINHHSRSYQNNTTFFGFLFKLKKPMIAHKILWAFLLGTIGVWGGNGEEEDDYVISSPIISRSVSGELIRIEITTEEKSKKSSLFSTQKIIKINIEPGYLIETPSPPSPVNQKQEKQTSSLSFSAVTEPNPFKSDINQKTRKMLIKLSQGDSPSNLNWIIFYNNPGFLAASGLLLGSLFYETYRFLYSHR